MFFSGLIRIHRFILDYKDSASNVLTRRFCCIVKRRKSHLDFCVYHHVLIKLKLNDCLHFVQVLWAILETSINQIVINKSMRLLPYHS